MLTPGARSLRAPSRRRSDEGFAILEVVIAMSLGALMLVALVRGVGAAQHGGRSARSTTQATALGRGALEEARGLGYAALAHVPGSTDTDPHVTAGEFDPDGGGSLAAEPVVESGDAELDPYVEVEHLDGTAFTISTFVTDAGSAKRASAVVEWTEGIAPRALTFTTLVPLSVEDIGAAASAYAGTFLGSAVPNDTYVEADGGGGSSSASEASFAPVAGTSGTGAATEASVGAGPSAHAETSVSTVAITIPGLSIAGSGILVTADSSPGSIGVTGSGSVTINGTPYTNPTAGSLLLVGAYRVVLNDQRLEADGSMSVTYIRITGPSTELSIAWAWVRPAVDLDV